METFEPENQIVTFSLFTFPTISKKIWAFSEMGLSKFYLKKEKGLTFFKLMGSGNGGGFSAKPDFSKYSFLGVFKDVSSAEHYHENSTLFKRIKEKATEIWTIQLKPIKTHGTWDSVSPFKPYPFTSIHGKLAVLTRASIRPIALPEFWQNVPQTSKSIENASGLIYSVGVGELPWIKQATFSIWENIECMNKFAYKDLHKDVVKKTRQNNWYSEELFARFSIVKSFGSLNGIDPLK